MRTLASADLAGRCELAGGRWLRAALLPTETAYHAAWDGAQPLRARGMLPPAGTASYRAGYGTMQCI